MTERFRLPSGGTAINRARPLSFTFDGKRMTGLAGDTLASALLANGVRLVGRSFKYHRPRGVFTAGPEEPNALVGLRRGDRTHSAYERSNFVRHIAEGAGKNVALAKHHIWHAQRGA